MRFTTVYLQHGPSSEVDPNMTFLHPVKTVLDSNCDQGCEKKPQCKVLLPFKKLSSKMSIKKKKKSKCPCCDTGSNYYLYRSKSNRPSSIKTDDTSYLLCLYFRI
jgi:hypothetical protein